MANKKKKVKTTVTTTVTEEIIRTNEKTQIICILDRSGSMSNIMDDSIGGFNTFIKQQKELPDEATLTVVLFDDKYELLYDNVDIKEVNEITSKEWFPRGSTSLHDAIGKTINNTKAHNAKLGVEAPSKTLVCIITDGYENTSREYSRDDVQKLIGDCEKNDWNFIYLAANQDAFDVGTSFGVSAGNTYTYTTTTDGIFNMSNTLSSAAVSYRSMSSSDADFSEKSKSLIDDDKNITENLGNITTGDFTVTDNTLTNN